MANWADTAPDETTAYVTVLTNLRDRDKDVANMFVAAPTNPAEGFMRFNRSLNLFQEYLSAVWTNKVLSVAGGGTGATTAAAARTALGLGTMALQNDNAVNITGGAIASAVSINAASITAGVIAQARLGAGATGAGQLVLADNQTWKLVETVPVGTGFMWFTATAPPGYHLCQGGTISRSTYAALFAVIGTTFGAGDGSTTFQLPNFQGRFPLGNHPGWGNGTLGGAWDHTHSGDDHLHYVPGHAHTTPNHAHTVQGHTHGPGTLVTQSHNHGGNTGTATLDNTNVGSGSAVNVTNDNVHSHTLGSSSLSVTGGTTGATAPNTNSGGSGATDSVAVVSWYASQYGGVGTTGPANPPFLSVTFIIKY